MTEQTAKCLAIKIAGRMHAEIIWAVDFYVYETIKGREISMNETRWFRSYKRAVTNALLIEGAVVRKITFCPSDPCRPACLDEGSITDAWP